MRGGADARDSLAPDAASTKQTLKMAAPTSCEAACRLLKEMRDSGVRSSFDVVKYWYSALDGHMDRIGDESEVYLIYEQVFIAALDCSDTPLAQTCLNAMARRFSKSLRVQRLRGMLCEALGKYAEADKVYESILEADEADPHVHKRRVVVLKSQDRIPDAIEALTKYLETFCVDGEAWMELCDLYLSQLDYEKAAFCMEELILSNPHNHLYHQKFADIKYSQGDVETARTYYAAALKLSPGNMRALFGLLLAASKVAAMKGSSAKVKADNLQYAAWVAEKISAKYKEASQKQTGGDRLSDVEAALQQLQVGSP